MRFEPPQNIHQSTETPKLPHHKTSVKLNCFPNTSFIGQFTENMIDIVFNGSAKPNIPEMKMEKKSS
jgi:hypothetical protein